MTVNDLKRKIVATEWDMGWFCCKCDGLQYWKTKAYMINDKCYCRKCAEETLSKKDMNK